MIRKKQKDLVKNSQLQYWWGKTSVAGASSVIPLLQVVMHQYGILPITRSSNILIHNTDN